MANVTLTNGTCIGRDEGAGERRTDIGDCEGEAVRVHGFFRAEREVASAYRTAAA